MTDDRVEAVRAAIEVALRDFQAPTPVQLVLEVGSSSGDDLIWVDKLDGSRTGFHVPGEATGDELLVRVADFLQDQVFDQLAQTWGEARPPCPGHQHAPDPRLLGGAAWWVCPATQEHLALIGTLR